MIKYLPKMEISARTRYGLRILLDIAQHEGDPSPRPIGAIASAQNISAAFISRLAVPLRRSKLIHAERGVGGGLRLAKSPDDITLLDIMEALDGPVSILKCLSQPKTCKKTGNCPAQTMWSDLNLTIKNALASMTLTTVLSRFNMQHDADYCI